MRKRASRRAGEDAEINVTPMLDVVFILLIFFIVTTSFVKETAIGASRPANAPAEEKKISEVVAVRIAESGEISVNERVVDIRAVRANIATALSALPEAAVVVIADRAADAGLLVRVIDQARLAGAKNVSLSPGPT